MHWCIVSLGAVAVVAVTLRSLIRKITANDRVITHVDEFVGNLCSSVFIMELGVIASMHGTYSIPLGLAGFIHLLMKFTYFMTNGLYGNPVTFVNLYYRNGRKVTFSLFHMATVVLTTMVGLYSGQKFVLFIWGFEDHAHVDAMHVACTTAISLAHPWTYAALSELFGVVIGTSIGFLTPTKFKPACGALVTTVLYFLFTHVSGMYMNPAIATTFNFRCEGQQSDWQHFLVYWVSPFVGTVIAWEFWLATNKFMQRKIPSKVE